MYYEQRFRTAGIFVSSAGTAACTFSFLKLKIKFGFIVLADSYFSPYVLLHDEKGQS